MGLRTIVKGSRNAFTILELLVVVAIIAILASLLVPVLVSARGMARQASCASNFRQAALAVNLYINDYDDRYMPVNHQPAENPNSSNDRTWVQMILPYIGTFQVFRCPGDDSDRPRRETMFDQDLVPGDTFSQYYTASLRTNLGYNFIYFSPIYNFGDNRWRSEPKQSTDVEYPAATVMLVDSVWTRSVEGTPTGGGSWLIVPPCRFEDTGKATPHDTFLSPSPSALEIYTDKAEGWELDNDVSRLQYGGAYPWHSGKMTVAGADGSARAMAPSQLLVGCDPGANWQSSFIRNRSSYLWDLR